MADVNEFYGTRYNDLLPAVLEKIQREIARITGMAEALQPASRLAMLEENEAEIKRFISSNLSDTYRKSVEGAYKDSIDQAIDLTEIQGLTPDLGATETEALSRLRRNQAVQFGVEAGKDADRIFQSMLEWSYTGAAGDIAPFFTEASRMTTARIGKTIVDTNVSAFFRSATFQTALSAGVKRFRYTGPAPEREFCQAIIGKVFTLDEIQKMSNGQTSNVFATGGGFNCRHRWTPVAPTAADLERPQKTDQQIQQRFNDLGLQPPNKDMIFVRRGGDTVGVIYRKVDPQTSTYNRFNGKKQKVKKDSDGNSFIDFTKA